MSTTAAYDCDSVCAMRLDGGALRDCIGKQERMETVIDVLKPSQAAMSHTQSKPMIDVKRTEGWE